MLAGATLFLGLNLGWAAAQAVLDTGGGVVVPDRDEENLPGCVVPTTKDLMAFNETLTLPDNCLLMYCREDRTIQYKHCPAVKVPENCTLTDYDRALLYPDCCPTLKCEGPDSEEVNPDVLDPSVVEGTDGT